MEKNKLLLVIGQFSLFFGLLGFVINSLVLDNNPSLAFITGILIGISLVLNLAYLLRMKRNNR
jgi:uncharacterized membrane protein YuzA (DUF378 family)